MKKLIVSTSVLIGVAVLGGGYLLWPNGSQSSTPVATTATSSAVTKKDTSKANRSQTTKSKATTDSTMGSSKSTATTSSSSAAETTASSSNSQSGSQATTGSTAATSSSAVASSAVSYLTAEQVNDWVWQQIATEYQGTKMTKADFSFSQTRKPDKLVYVEVREANNDQVSHLVATFRVNAQGQLEKQDTAKGATVWDVVAQSYQ